MRWISKCSGATDCQISNVLPRASRAAWDQPCPISPEACRRADPALHLRLHTREPGTGLKESGTAIFTLPLHCPPVFEDSSKPEQGKEGICYPSAPAVLRNVCPVGLCSITRKCSSVLNRWLPPVTFGPEAAQLPPWASLAKAVCSAQCKPDNTWHPERFGAKTWCVHQLWAAFSWSEYHAKEDETASLVGIEAWHEKYLFCLIPHCLKVSSLWLASRAPLYPSKGWQMVWG